MTTFVFTLLTRFFVIDALPVVRVLLGLCLLAYVAYALLSLRAARLWHRARPTLAPDWTPAVTIFKPVRGVDAEAYENFASFCRQDYPPDRVQILFGALDPADPALELACRLKTEFPRVCIDIVSDRAPVLHGPNRKVCNLAAMLPHARHDLLILCDSDMRVAPDYLRRVTAPFQPETSLPSPPEISRTDDAFHSASKPAAREVGLVTCPYRGHRARSLAARLEALGIGADFIPSALVSRATEGAAFAFGSTIALPRRVLSELGGFEALADELADDYRLGSGARKAGYEVVVSDYVVEDVLGAERLGAMWARRLRWARTVRACRPAGYAGSLITHGGALATLFALSTGFSAFGLAALALVLLVRFGITLAITRRYTGDPAPTRFLPLLPLSDLVSFALFVVSYCGSDILWRGERFRLQPGGKLKRKPFPLSTSPRSPEISGPEATGSTSTS